MNHNAVHCLRKGVNGRSFHFTVAILVSIILWHKPAVDAFTGSVYRNNHKSASRRTIGVEFNQRTHQNFPRVTSESSFLLQGFLDGLFGDSSNSEDGLLATYDINVDSKDVDIRFESLSDYITNKWINLFESGEIKLTTPVKLLKGENGIGQDDSSRPGNTVRSSSCRLVFQKVDSGYESDEEEESADSESKSSDKEQKQGGVEIEVQMISENDVAKSLRVEARRCEIDENTMIKEMSEEKIVKELQKAIDVWKKN